jgi:2-iminobutanoate/2-iminopropanoate deaminase
VDDCAIARELAFVEYYPIAGTPTQFSFQKLAVCHQKHYSRVRMQANSSRFPFKEAMMQKENIQTEQAPAAIGPYVQAVRVGDLIYTAGQGGLDPATGELVEGGVEAQAEQTMKNLAAVLEAAGSSFDQVVKTTIFLRYIKNFAAVNEVYASFFGNQFPARSTVAVAALPMGALVEIEMVALAPRAENIPVEEHQESEVEMSKDKKEKKGKKDKKKKKGKKKKK